VARKPREELEGAIHHVYARGNGQQRIFLDDQDRRTYLFLLARVIEEQDWRCLAYCLMDNHVHLLIETPRANLGRGMQRLHSRYAQLFNERHGRVGHLFQGRYGAVRIETDAQLQTTLAYIAANPVRSGLCRRACDWPWSSYRHASAGDSAGLVAIDRLTWHLGGFATDPLNAYRELVEGSDPSSVGDSGGQTP